MYVLSWRTVSALTRVLFWYLFIKHQNNPLVSAETIRHSSTYIILYIFDVWDSQVDTDSHVLSVGYFGYGIQQISS